MTRYLLVSLITLLTATAPAWSDEGASEGGRYQVISDVPLPARAGKPRAGTILLDTLTGRTWALASGSGAAAEKRAISRPIWRPIPVEDLGLQEALAGPGRGGVEPELRGRDAPAEPQREGYRDRLWNYERDP